MRFLQLFQQALRVAEKAAQKQDAVELAVGLLRKVPILHLHQHRPGASHKDGAVGREDELATASRIRQMSASWLT